MIDGKDVEEEGGRGRSPAFPVAALPKCLTGAKALYEKDRFAAMPLEAVAKHLGYGGLNGASKPYIGALRQFGLIAYKDSGKGTKASLTDLAKRILLPHSEAEKSAAIVQAFESCKVFGRVLAHFPDGHLPSDETLRNLLVREFGFTESSAKGFMASLRTSKEFVESLRGSSASPPVESSDDGPPSTAPTTQEPQAREETSQALHRLSMPGTDYYLALPRDLDPKTARRMERWVKAVVLPALQFAASDDEEESGE